MRLSSDVLEFIQLLNKNEVQYLVVGGWAVGLHGIPRYTKDVDILISKSADNATKILKALEDFGFGGLDIKISDLTRPNFVIQLGKEPNRIDLLTDIIEVDFNESWRKKVVSGYQGTAINYIEISDLIRNKQASGRMQDLADAESLKKIQLKKRL